MGRKRAVIYGGGTLSHVRPHLSLAAKAYGATARALVPLLAVRWNVDLRLTKMAGGKHIETTEDLRDDVIDTLKDKDVQVIVMSAAVVDFQGVVDHTGAPDDATIRLDSSDRYTMRLLPEQKIISEIRKERKDIFLVGFKTTWDVTNKTMIRKGLELLKKSSCNLVLANDIKTRYGAVVTPELAAYGLSQNRDHTLKVLEDMIFNRAGLTYTRTWVTDGAQHLAKGVDALEAVVKYCVRNGAYKPFLGVTSGHFGHRERADVLWSSRRKKDYNKEEDRLLVRVKFLQIEDKIAADELPSVGVRSQMSILDEEFDCVVHFHCPLKPGSKVHVQPQIHFECGSHECGRNTQMGLKLAAPGIKAVMLDKHGPNITFSRHIDPEKVTKFIEENFDLTKEDAIQ